MLIVFTVRHEDDILLAVIMSNTSGVQADVNEVVLELLDEIVHWLLLISCLYVLTFCQTTVCLDLLVKGFLVNHRECGLLDIEQHTDLTATDALIVCLLFRRECLIVGTADLGLRVFLLWYSFSYTS
jgi:hypothetical protein